MAENERGRRPAADLRGAQRLQSVRGQPGSTFVGVPSVRRPGLFLLADSLARSNREISQGILTTLDRLEGIGSQAGQEAIQQGELEDVLEKGPDSIFFRPWFDKAVKEGEGRKRAVALESQLREKVESMDTLTKTPDDVLGEIRTLYRAQTKELDPNIALGLTENSPQVERQLLSEFEAKKTREDAQRYQSQLDVITNDTLSNIGDGASATEQLEKLVETKEGFNAFNYTPEQQRSAVLDSAINFIESDGVDEENIDRIVEELQNNDESPFRNDPDAKRRIRAAKERVERDMEEERVRAARIKAIEEDERRDELMAKAHMNVNSDKEVLTFEERNELISITGGAEALGALLRLEEFEDKFTDYAPNGQLLDRYKVDVMAGKLSNEQIYALPIRRQDKDQLYKLNIQVNAKGGIIKSPLWRSFRTGFERTRANRPATDPLTNFLNFQSGGEISTISPQNIADYENGQAILSEMDSRLLMMERANPELRDNSELQEKAIREVTAWGEAQLDAMRNASREAVTESKASGERAAMIGDLTALKKLMDMPEDTAAQMNIKVAGLEAAANSMVTSNNPDFIALQELYLNLDRVHERIDLQARLLPNRPIDPWGDIPDNYIAISMAQNR